MQETQVQSLGLEGPLEKEMATHSSILAWEIPWTEEWSLVDYSPWGPKESDPIEHVSIYIYITTYVYNEIIMTATSVISKPLKNGKNCKMSCKELIMVNGYYCTDLLIHQSIFEQLPSARY